MVFEQDESKEFVLSKGRNIKMVEMELEVFFEYYQRLYTHAKIVAFLVGGEQARMMCPDWLQSVLNHQRYFLDYVQT
ncbi:unnamed protein product [Schistosoma curassoni]|uniref:Transcriptional regulator n=1 Tax=Schistosoma curassoni TaxID=6186 RepID=A0A183JMS8_9TREM|nr:unnamed protein product [Schistosoma curassoni]